MQTSSPAFGVIAESPCIGVIKCEPPAAEDAGPDEMEWSGGDVIEWSGGDTILWSE